MATTRSRVLNKLGRQTAKGNPWSQFAVHTARRNHGIKGRTDLLMDPEVRRGRAGEGTHTSDTTIRNLVEGGRLPLRQVVPFAPQEIPRADLNQPRMRLRGARPLDAHRTSRAGDTSDTQAQLFL